MGGDWRVWRLGDWSDGDWMGGDWRGEDWSRLKIGGSSDWRGEIRGAGDW